ALRAYSTSWGCAARLLDQLGVRCAPTRPAGGALRAYSTSWGGAARLLDRGVGALRASSGG
ncbi:MAG TPA: hypothetical protein VKY66_03300, partial [Protaetiibacter sp.]|nr:hypothetical protein [Protaetiibacter sp.]